MIILYVVIDLFRDIETHTVDFTGDFALLKEPPLDSIFSLGPYSFNILK